MENHPSKNIIGTKGEELKGKRVVLCITGSVAATRCPETARELMRHGAEVFTVMSEMAQKIIHPYLMEWATGNPVVTELTGKIEHIALVGEHLKKADLALIAPATSNTISKIAHGIDDTPVTSIVSTALGSKVPIIIVPAMHGSMYRHQIISENIKKLQALGVEFIGPRVEEGKAKIASTEEVVEGVIRRLVEKDMAGLRVLVTAGPTLEYIDPIRVITNRSSGKMGIAIVKEALRRGAEATLIYGPGTALPPQGVRVAHVKTTKEMYEAVISELKSTRYDIFIAAAAVADFAPERAYNYKVPTSGTPELTLRLNPTPKIVNEVKKVQPGTFLAAFKAEYNMSDNELINRAYELLKSADADLVVANDIGRKNAGFQVDTNEVFIINKSKEAIHIPTTSKQKIAKKLLDTIICALHSVQ